MCSKGHTFRAKVLITLLFNSYLLQYTLGVYISLCITILMCVYSSYVMFHVWENNFIWQASRCMCSCLPSRVCLQMWPNLIAKSKVGGADVIQTYVFWSGHEPVKGKV